jgi:hypothetical protein
VAGTLVAQEFHMSKRSYAIVFVVFIVLAILAITMRGDGGFVELLKDLHGGR